MNAKRDFQSIVLFLVLSLGFSAGYWAINLLWPKGSLPHAVEVLTWSVLRGFGPAIAAIIASLYMGGLPACIKLMRSVVQWRVSWKLYALTFLGPIAIVGVAILVAILRKELAWNSATNFTPHLIFLFIPMLLLDGPLGEEIGWRGFLLPALLKKKSAFVASLFVGFIWYIWHVPLYAIDGKGASLLFLVDCIALSFVFTWFFIQSRGSTFLIILLHNASNYFIYVGRVLFPHLHDVVISQYVYFLLVCALGIVTAIALRHNRTAEDVQFPGPGRLVGELT